MNVRPFTDDDAPAVAALISADEERLYGRPGHVTGARHPHVPALQQGGVGLGGGRPDRRERDLRRARRRGARPRRRRRQGPRPRDGDPRARRGVRARGGCEKILTGAAEPDAAARALFESRGYREVRRFYEMAIELTEEPTGAGPAGRARRGRDPRGRVRGVLRRAERGVRGALGVASAAVRGVDRAPAGPAPRRARPDLVRRPRRRRARRGHAQRARASPAAATSARSASGPAWRGKGLAKALLQRTFAEFWRRGTTRVTLDVDSQNATGAVAALRARRHARRSLRRRLREGARMSLLRARCPDCRTLTAVAVDDGYECHSCGRTFRAGLVRVPRAWGDGGEPMVEAASLAARLPRGRGRRGGHARDADARGRVRPARCGRSCSAVAAARTSASSRASPPATSGSRVLWLDAHGDLNTPETSPSGNEWGMPLRMLLDHGTVAADDVVLWGARNLDPPEEEFIAAAGIGDDPARCSSAPTPSTSRSTATSSTRASWRSSCPSRAGRRSARSSSCWRGCGRAASSSASASPGSRPIPRTSRSCSGSPRARL